MARYVVRVCKRTRYFRLECAPGPRGRFQRLSAGSALSVSPPARAGGVGVRVWFVRPSPGEIRSHGR